MVKDEERRYDGEQKFQKNCCTVYTHTGYKHPRWTKKKTFMYPRHEWIQTLHYTCPATGTCIAKFVSHEWRGYMNFFFFGESRVFVSRVGIYVILRVAKIGTQQKTKMYPFNVGINNILDTFYLPSMWCCVHTHTFFFRSCI